MKPPTVQILLASYNSQAFLADLLESLERQTCQDWQLLVRDDGSTDRTVTMLEAFFRRQAPGRATWAAGGPSVGPCQSFGRLLEASSAPYVMFCDHDDVWRPDKVERTLAAMRRAEAGAAAGAPVLVFTDLEVVDGRLNRLGASYWAYHHADPRRTSLAPMLVQNVATGCTMMLNRPLADLAAPIPPQAVMHDHWAALVATCFGTIQLLNEPTLLYRQHDGNVLGVPRWGPARMLRRLGSGREARQDLARAIEQARVLLERYADRLPADKKEVLAAFASLPEQSFLRKRMTLVRHRLFKNGLLRTLGLFLDV